MNDLEAAVQEGIVFLDHFSEMPDPRQAGKVVYPLNEILLLSFLAVLSGAETFTGIAEFGHSKLPLLRSFLPYANETPDHDRIGEIFSALDAEAFQRCFASWVSSITGIPSGVIAIDGKTSRRSGSKSKGKEAIHTVSAFGAQQRMVLGQVQTATKSNEITAIPALLEMLDIKGAVVTIDAMGCQRGIARKIVDKGGDYILALKGNQSALHDDVRTFVTEQKAKNFADTTITRHEETDGEHGRIVIRKTTVVHDIAWLQERHNWPGLAAVIIVESTTLIGDKTTQEARYYVTSSAETAEKHAMYVRQHWLVESMHWTLDCIFRDDDCRARTGHAAANFVTVKHIALNILKRHPAKISLTSKRLRAGWDEKFLLSCLSAAL